MNKYLFTGFIAFIFLAAYATIAQAQIQIDPEQNYTCSGENTNFSIVPDPSYHEYEWEVNTGDAFVQLENNTNYDGVNTEQLVIYNLDLTFNGNQYRCHILDGLDWVYSDTAILYVNDAPDTPSSATDTEPYCNYNIPDEIIFYTDTEYHEADTLYWYNPEGILIFTGNAEAADEVSLTGDTIPNDPGSYVFKSFWGNECGMSDNDSIIINVTQGQTLSISYEHSEFCNNVDTNYIPLIENSGSGDLSYSVNSSNFQIIENTGVFNPYNQQDGTYIITCHSSDSCVLDGSCEIKIKKRPNAGFTLESGFNDEYIYCESGDPVKINFNENNNYSLTTDENGLIIADTNYIILNGSAPGTYTITNTVDSLECTDEFSISLDVYNSHENISFTYPDPIMCLSLESVDTTETSINQAEIMNFIFKSDNIDVIDSSGQLNIDKIGADTVWFYEKHGCSDTARQSIEVKADFNPHFSYEKESYCSNEEIVVNAGFETGGVFCFDDENPIDWAKIIPDNGQITPDDNKGGVISVVYKNESIYSSCVFSDTNSIFVDFINIKSNIEDIDNQCKFEEFELKLNIETAEESDIKYKWYEDGNLISEENGEKISIILDDTDGEGHNYFAEINTYYKDSMACSGISNIANVKLDPFNMELVAKGGSLGYPNLLIAAEPGYEYQWYYQENENSERTLIEEAANSQYFYPANYNFNNGQFKAGNYYLETKDKEGSKCSSWKMYEIIPPLVGMKSDQIVILPNPSKGLFSMLFMNDMANEKNLHFQIYNLNGSMIYESYSAGQSQDFDFRSYSKGVYVVKISETGIIPVYQKIIIQ